MQDSEKRIIFRYVSAIQIASRVIFFLEVSIRIILIHNIIRCILLAPYTGQVRIHLFLFISLTLKHFSRISCIFQKKSVSFQKISCVRQSVSKLTLRSFAFSLQKKSINPLKLEVNMEIKDNARKENFFLKLIEIKKEIRNCVQNGGNLHQIEKQYGIRFSKPL